MTRNSSRHGSKTLAPPSGTSASSPRTATAAVSGSGSDGGAVGGVVPCTEEHVNKASSCIENSVRRRFEPWELGLIKEGALQEYGLLKNSSERREVEREETMLREDLIADATSFFAALAAWKEEAGGELLNDRAMRLLLHRLGGRAAAQQRQDESREEALRAEGRAAWRHEVEETARLEQQEQALEQWRRECEQSLRAACAFLIGTEASWRRDEAAVEAAAWSSLCARELADRSEAERLAYENLMNSPEQVALREERERKEAAANRAAARQMKRFLHQQEELVKSCRHGRGHASLFEGPVARKLCVLCGVKFDDTLGYYVRIRGGTIAPPEALTATRQHSTAMPATTTLPPIVQPPEQQQQQKKKTRTGSVAKKPPAGEKKVSVVRKNLNPQKK